MCAFNAHILRIEQINTRRRCAEVGIRLSFSVAERTFPGPVDNLTETLKGISFQLHVTGIDEPDRRWCFPEPAFENKPVVSDDRAIGIPQCYRTVAGSGNALSMHNDRIVFNRPTRTKEGDTVTAVHFDHLFYPTHQNISPDSYTCCQL